VLLGVGDDAALLTVAPGARVVVTAATWVGAEPGGTALPPEAVGHRLLAAALAELAAAGAEPRWLTLALTLPEPDPNWLAAFRDALHSLGQEAGVELVGGDTTSGPPAATLHAHGVMAAGREPVPVDGARPGDLVYVTGTPGDAGLALLVRRQELRLPGPVRTTVEARLVRPTPRLAQAPYLPGLASAATNLADGLIAALARLSAASGLGAAVYADQLPLSEALHSHLDLAGGWVVPLTAPEPGELCLVVPAERQALVAARLASLPGGCAWVGTIERAPGIRCVLATGEVLSL